MHCDAKLHENVKSVCIACGFRQLLREAKRFTDLIAKAKSALYKGWNPKTSLLLGPLKLYSHFHFDFLMRIISYEFEIRCNERVDVLPVWIDLQDLYTPHSISKYLQKF